MKDLLTRYWVEAVTDNPAWKTMGVTAFSEEDALNMIKGHLKNKEPFEVLKITRDVEISHLDQNHVVPNIGSIHLRGIWYPNVHMS